MVLSLLAFLITGCESYRAGSARDHYCRSLSFPHIRLGDGERIESIEIKLACGRFVAIDRIPNDWSLDMAGPSSEISTLKLSANHGSSMLWHSEDLNGIIVIQRGSGDCFDITATFQVSVGNNERTVLFSRREISMRREQTSP